MMKKKFTKERFYKKLNAQKLKAHELMFRIEQGIQLAKDVFNVEKQLNQAINDRHLELVAQLTIQRMNLQNRINLLTVYKI